MIELKNNNLIWKINFDAIKFLSMFEILNFENIFIAYDSNNRIMKSRYHRYHKRFYDIER